MKAPEKLYLDPDVVTDEPDRDWYIQPMSNESVEYTRTDAFIEKATKWINEHTSLSEKLVIENFRKYMEGE